MDRDTMVLLPESPLAQLSEADLVAIADALEEQSFSAYDTLMAEGEQSDVALLILEGDVSVRSFRAGRDEEVQRLGPGEMVGMLGMIHAAPRTADVRAITDGRAARLTRESYERLVTESARIGVAFELMLGRQLAGDVRAVTNRVADAYAASAASHPDGAEHDYDVVVIGAGYIGISFACWVKKERPETRIAVLDKRSAPGYKIGESSLGPTIRNLASLGIPMSVLRRLFHVKLELSAWWTDVDTDEATGRISPGFFDESYQFERRVLETLMATHARRLGIEIFEDTVARVRDSDIEGPDKVLIADGPEGVARFRYKILCDASGPASVIPKALGLYTKRLDGLNTNAYFGYFKKKSEVEGIVGWDNASTRHLCFPDGWVWFIELASWQKSSDENLETMLEYLLDFEGSDEEYPTRRELSDRFECPVEEVFSIGVVPRADTDESTSLPVQQRFQYYVDKYPAFKRIMDCFELIEDVYPGHRSFKAFMKMSHDSERVTGDGWLAVGDSAFFVNPLWSPGLAYGAGSSYIAALDVVAALNSGSYGRQAFANYQKHARAIFNEVFKENEMFYRAFADPVSYERVGMMKFTVSGYAAISTMLGMLPPDAPRPPVDRPFPETRLPGDHVFGAVTFPLMIDTVAEVVDVMREGEMNEETPSVTGQKVKAIIDGTIESLLGTEALKLTDMTRRLPHYTAELVRDEDQERDPLMKIWRCPQCRGWNQLVNPVCHVCGEKQPGNPVLER